MAGKAGPTRWRRLHGSVASRRLSVHPLQDGRDAHAGPDALGGEAVAAARAAELLRDGRHEPGAGRAERVADRDRAAVHVHLRERDPEVTAARQHLGGKSLVELDAIDLARLDPGVSERLLR